MGRRGDDGSASGRRGARDAPDSDADLSPDAPPPVAAVMSADGVSPAGDAVASATASAAPVEPPPAGVPAPAASQPRDTAPPAKPAAASHGRSWRAGVREWIADHDHRWLFVILYLGLAVVLSVFVSLFWLVFMATLHLLLECVRHRHPGWGPRRILTHAAWEVKLDFALVLLALAMVLYVDVVLGVLGIQSAARAAAVTRAGARAASRFAAWERNLRAFLVTMDEMFRVARAVVMVGRKKARKAAPVAVAAATSNPWTARWGLGDHVSIAIGSACIVLMLTAPFFTPFDWPGVLTTLLEELRPFPA